MVKDESLGSPFVALVLSLAVVYGAVGDEPVAVEGTRPNVVLIISDDHGWDDYSFMGHPHVRTPHIDRLAREGVLFPRGYCPSSLCCPSLATIITGLYPHEHKITSNDPPLPRGVPAPRFHESAAFRVGRDKMVSLFPRSNSLPTLMQERGYVSLQTGKWWMGDYKTGGFTHGMTVGQRHGDKGVTIGRETMAPIHEFVSMAAREKKPFFVWYAPMLPHQPHDPPARLLEKYEKLTPSPHVVRYWAMVERFDETVGELLQLLDEKNLARETVVIYVTDNGWIQDPDHPRYAPRSKQSPYDGGLRTPIIVRWLGHLSPRRESHPVSSIDIAPTLLSLLGLTTSTPLPGVNLLDEASVAGRQSIFGECFTHNAVDLERPEASLRWRWIIRNGWKLIVPNQAVETEGKVELFHIEDDAREAHDLAREQPKRVEELETALNEWWNPAAER